MKIALAFIGSLVMAVAVGVVAFTAGLTVGAGSALNAAACGSLTSVSASVVPSAASGEAPAEGSDAEMVFQEVQKKVGDDHRLMLAHLMGTWLESRWNRMASDGEAYGVYQIQMPGVVHPDVTIEEARNIVFAVNYMHPAYVAAARREEVQELWAAGNAVGAAEANAYYAEKPKYIYHQSQGQGTVEDAYNASIELMRRHGIEPDFSQVQVTPEEQTARTQLVSEFSRDKCKTGGTTSSGDAATLVAFSGASGDRQKVLDSANAHMGLPYAWGGGNANGPTKGICESGAAWNDCNIVGFDCSGLTEYAYAQVGINLPSTAATQWNATKAHVVVPHGGDLAAAKPGDLVFFTGYRNSFTTPGHVGIYIGNGQMINAPQSGEDVKITDITTAHWRNTLVGITDPFALAA